MDVFSTGVQFSNIWLRIDDEDLIVISTDEGTELFLTAEEAAQLAQSLDLLVSEHNSIYADPTAEDDDE